MPKELIPSPLAKGNELEDAVRAIEGAILTQAAGFAESSFNVHGKKIIRHGGVKHEIDIYVTANLPAEYTSVFIFECKNWEKKVGKNEIIVFEDKIKATSAQRGFFVAKSFTRDARARAKQCDRITLLLAAHVKPLTRIVFPQFLLFSEKAVRLSVLVLGFGERTEIGPLDLKGKPLVIDGQVHDAEEYITALAVQLKDKKLVSGDPSVLEEGLHSTEFSEVHTFEKGRLTIEGRAIQTIQIKGKLDFEFAIASVESIYEVASRGRYLTVGVQSGGIKLEAKIVQAAGQ